MQLTVDVTPDTIYLLRSVERFQILSDRPGLSDVAAELLASIVASMAQHMEFSTDPLERHELRGLLGSVEEELDGFELVARLNPAG